MAAPTPGAPLLDGIRVIDLTAVVLGPLATQQLADYGADVIKIEPPEGDMMRANGVSRHPGMSSIYLGLNRNKRSVALDLKTEAGRAALRRLLPTADVLVHNMRVPAVERLGFGYEAVRALHPGIVYCAATGFAQDGPHALKPAFDDIIQSASGLASLSAQDAGGPTYLPSLIADKVSGLATAQAILAALVRRLRTGQGAYVEVPMLETMTAFTLAEHMGHMAFVGDEGPAGYARLLSGGRQVMPTSDGHISLLPYTPRHWAAFFEALERPDLNERYDTRSRASLNANIRALYAELLALGPSRSTAEWMALCERLDIPATPVYGLSDLPRHPHLAAVGLFETSEHPTEGPLRQVRPTTLVDGAAPPITRHAPSVGEHTAEVLRAEGFTDQEIAALWPAATP
ncbi:MAG: CoA transferase [Proteobacteria bacterium]|nr:CoA transferase [Pseudomonadota bacterium]